MPGKIDEGAGDNLGRCKRCSSQAAEVVVRSEALCGNCFLRYVATKFTKRMESYRVRNSTEDAPPKLLIPVSLGVSSVTLLWLLNKQLKGQLERVGRAGFKLLICSVEVDLGGEAPPEAVQALKERFPEHEHIAAHLTDVFDYDEEGGLWAALEPPEEMSRSVPSRQGKLNSIFRSLSSTTSREDIHTILLTRLISFLAKAHECESVLWGDTTTRLAEKTLSLTSNGRGASIPHLLNDDTKPHGVKFKYPLRDLLRRELVQHARFIKLSIDSLIIKEDRMEKAMATSGKNASVEGLMTNYFEGVEEAYPSVVANVVKMVGKLDSSKWSNNSICAVCSVSVEVGEGVSKENRLSRRNLCYGCLRALSE
ncbi:MAG: cytoplasmic tRNA 2-thiolation protein 2 [Vezdaea acicularis]|nr:MAG: cytoplasmic tRNA 2-thiolation protein 2 [Vezdaea acicularis]